ncbi:hypothetical protein [Pseudomonas brassicacearum]|uniref:hypothetical protein n=1 Tax=Pseudomonas brassicacearum TaxID=930166 RepID=UPI001BDE68EC|nr:hypothetical protein [Pseudomonas brassicacearum]
MEIDDDERDDSEEYKVSGGGFFVVDLEQDEALPAASTAVIASAENFPLATYRIYVWVATLFGIKIQADLDVECSWSSSGTFTCHTSRYKVSNIGGNSGNIEFGFSSAGTWEGRQITGSARQDGIWHDIRAGGSVAGNSREARVWFRYTFDISMGGDPSVAHTMVVAFSLSPPTITNPRVVREPRPTLRGTGASGAIVKLYESGVGTVLFATATVHGDQWTARLTEPLWMADPFSLTAYQALNGIDSGWATPVSFAVLFKPVISTINVSADRKPTILGSGGLRGATLEIWREGGTDGVQLTTSVQPSGTWSVSATAAWPPGRYSITARQIGQDTQQSSDWSDNKAFTIKPPKPVITAPPNPAPANQVLTITGVYSGAVTLQMLTETGAVVSGTFTNSGTTRTFTPGSNWAPGTQKVKVVQTANGVASDPSDLVTLAVKPPKPVITNPLVVKIDKPTIHGAGVADATVSLYQHGVGTILFGTATVHGDQWTAQLTEPLWMADPFTLTASQTLNGMTSDWADTIDFAVLFRPVITTVTVSADGKPTVSGTGGLEGATIDIRLQGGVGGTLLTTTVRTGGTWSAPANAPWYPNTYIISAKQIGRVTQQSSDGSVKTFTVKPSKPAITAPPNPAPANQVLSITGVYSGTVLTLKMLTEAGAEISGTFSASGTSRTFTPTAGWTVGTIKKVKVVQTVGSIASDPSDLVTLAIKPPKPAITAPPNPAPANQVLSITGVYSGTVTLQMLTETGAVVSGTFTNSGISRTFTPTAEWTAGSSKVKVVQTVGAIASDPSNPVTLAVKPPRPVITAPPNPAAAKQVLTVTGVYVGAVVLTMFTETGSPIAGTFSTSGASRTFTPTENWAVGSQKVKVVQTVDGIVSYPSEWVTLAVRPPKPTITNPNVVWTALPTLSGGGVAGATVNLHQHNFGSVILGTGTVQSDNTWTVTLTEPLQMADPFRLTASQTLNGMTSDWATTIDFAVLFKPVIASIIVSADGKPTVGGTAGLKDATLNIHLQGNSSDVQLTTTVEPNGTWLASSTVAWAPEAYVITARQLGKVTGQRSDWAEHESFIVKPPKPVITAPPNPAPADQVLTVTGVYSGAATLAMFTETGSPIAGTFSATGETSRTFTPAENWAAGTQKVKVVQTVNEVASDPSDECTLNVEVGDQPEVPLFELPLSGSRTSTRPAIRITGQPLALITVRPEGAETLHSAPADAEGVLEFVVSAPLTPGPQTLEAKQKGSGPESNWSELHLFTVKALPQTPVIEAPTPGSLNPRKPTIRGRGENRGQILLGHKDDQENLIGTLNGVASWRWTATDSWEVGQYTIQAQQTDDGDNSSWTEPRTFEVVDALYGTGDAGPVLAQPVLSNSESVLLRVQIVSGLTGEPAGGVTVEWRIAGEQAVMARTVTGPDGWAHYLYTPGIAGEQTVLADLTSENQGVGITERFEVTALSDNPWGQESELYLGDEKVDLAKGDLVLSGAKHYELSLEVNSASPLVGTSVTLEDVFEAEAHGLKFVPPLGTSQSLIEGQPVYWSIACDPAKIGYFGLKLTSPILPDWYLPGQVIDEGSE